LKSPRPEPPTSPASRRRRTLLLYVGTLVATALIIGLGAMGALGLGWMLSGGAADSSPSEPTNVAAPKPLASPKPILEPVRQQPTPGTPDPEPASTPPASQPRSAAVSAVPRPPPETPADTPAVPEPEQAPEPASEEEVPEPEPIEEDAVADAALPSDEAQLEESAEERAQRVSEQMARDLVGTWKGSAQGRPFQLRILSASANGVRAELVFNPGPAQQVTGVTGQYAEGRLSLGDGALRLSATLSGGALEGSYARGKREVDFKTTR